MADHQESQKFPPDEYQYQESQKFPPDEHQYVLLAATGSEDAASVHRGKRRDPAGNETPVSIKVVDVYKIKDIYSLTREVHLAETCDHENVVKVHRSFRVKNNLWIIMPPLPDASLRQIIRSSFSDGLPVNAVVFILKEVLKGLDYLHGKNMVHENVNAGCIFMHEKSTAVKLAFESLTVCSKANRLPEWTIAPELIMDYKKGNSKATDIWMFGLLALELFHGRIPASNIREFQAHVTEIENQSQELKLQNGSRPFLEKIRSSFTCFHQQSKEEKIQGLWEVLAACLSPYPEKRPTANELLNYGLFKGCSKGKKSLKCIGSAVVHGKEV